MIEEPVALTSIQKTLITPPTIMGIINITDNSFYDGGKYKDDNYINNLINEFNECNVGIIDIGAESSRPGSIPISYQEEISRLSNLIPHIKKKTNALISIDTCKAETAQFVLDEGADIINDITAGESDKLLSTISKYNAGVILMHKKGTPKTMQKSPTYHNVIQEVKTYLNNQINKAKSFGINLIMVDPGIGFGKTCTHNIKLLKNIDAFKPLKCPIVIGTSNKSFIEDLTGATIANRLPGSIASVIAAYQKGAHIFRVHNVKETHQALTIFKAINE